jgi:hypothetical protein
LARENNVGYKSIWHAASDSAWAVVESEVAMDMGWMGPIAILTILPVPMGLFFLLNGRVRKVLASAGALGTAGLSVCVASNITGWMLVGPGHPNSDDWIGFIVINAIIGAVTAFPGGLIGLIIGNLIDGRKSPSVAENTEKELVRLRRQVADLEAEKQQRTEAEAIKAQEDMGPVPSTDIKKIPKFPD